MLLSVIVAIISQYIHILKDNMHTLNIYNFSQLYLNKAGEVKKYRHICVKMLAWPFKLNSKELDNSGRWTR